MNNRMNTVKLVIAILLGVALIGFWGFSSFQKYKTISDLEATIETKNKELSVAEGKFEQLIALKQNRNLIAQKRNLFETVIPKTPQEREIYEYIKNITDAYNVFIEGMEFQNRVDRGNYYEMPIALQVAGSYNGVVHVLDEIQKGDRMVNIMELSISKGQAGNICAAVKLEAFYRPPGMEKPVADEESKE